MFFYICEEAHFCGEKGVAKPLVQSSLVEGLHIIFLTHSVWFAEPQVNSCEWKTC